MCLKVISLGSTVPLVNQVFYNNLKRLLLCPTTTVYSQVVLANYLTFLVEVIVMKLLNG